MTRVRGIPTTIQVGGSQSLGLYLDELNFLASEAIRVAAACHTCACYECTPSLDTYAVYGDVEGPTAADHLAVRFGDWEGGKRNPEWFPILLDGKEIEYIYEVDKQRGVIWAYRDPLHICLTCARAHRPYGPCAVRLTGVVEFGTAIGDVA